MKEKLIKFLGGYTKEELIRESKLRTINELFILKYAMDDNYGTDWTSEVYETVNSRILELEEEVYG